MLKKRVIPCLLLKDLNLVKSIQFGLHSDTHSMRNIGNAIAAVKVFNARDVDELVFLDISATDEQRPPHYPIIADIARECFMPLAVGGGVSTIEHVERLLAIGADKVVINTSAIQNPEFISTVANRYGAQCVVVSIDAKKYSDGSYYPFLNHGSVRHPLPVSSWAKECERLGAGEIFLTAIDCDGMMEGYDLELTNMVATSVGIPVIASGGAGKPDHCVEVVREGKADAVSAASIFQYTQFTPQDIKMSLHAAGIPARI
jgi:cyclase